MNDNLILMFIKKIKKIFMFVIILIIFLIISSLTWIYSSTKDYIYNNVSDLPYSRVGLVPGCNKYISDGVLNVYYVERINSAVKLFNTGKIDFILVSGDNAHKSYDEPREMRSSLIELGIPNDKIFSDYAGFRTLDTIVRAKEVFKLYKLTFISQDFQNARGVFIGRNKGIDIVAFNANNNSQNSDFKTRTRELFAKMKMILDLYIIAKEPKFLGDEILIN